MQKMCDLQDGNGLCQREPVSINSPFGFVGLGSFVWCGSVLSKKEHKKRGDGAVQAGRART